MSTVNYTPLIGLALPTQGDLSGAWGTEVNEYISKYVDAAVAGAQTISGSQTAVTLSVTNGVSLSQAGIGSTGSSQYAIINCIGNPASLLTITVPAASKVYLVNNATSTSQSVKIVGAGPTTGVTLAAGEKAVVAWDGSDFVKIATSVADGVTSVNVSGGTTGLTTSGGPVTSTGTITLAGTLGVANGGTGATSLTANNVILGNGTSAVQVVAPGASGNVLTSNGTTWQSTAIPSGYVQGPASAVDNAITRFDGTTGKLIQNSSATIDDSGNAVFGGTVSETVGGTQYLVVSQYDIGTAPNEIPLNQYLGNLAYQDADAIAGNVVAGGGITANDASVISVNSSSDALRITQTGSGNALVVEDSTNPDSSPFVVDASGNLGIGTTSPGGKLDVNGDAYFGSTSFGYSVYSRSTNNWNYANLSLIRNSTNTATPRFLSMMLDGDSTSSTTIGGYNAIWGAYDSSPTTGSTSAALNGAMVYGAYAGHRWYTNGTERLRIASDGNVTFKNAITETVYTLGTSGSIALNPANGTIQTCAAAGTVTFTDSLSSGQSISLRLTSGSSYTINWPTITWVTSAGNTAPTLTANDTLVFWKISTTLYGAYVGSGA